MSFDPSLLNTAQEEMNPQNVATPQPLAQPSEEVKPQNVAIPQPLAQPGELNPQNGGHGGYNPRNGGRGRGRGGRYPPYVDHDHSHKVNLDLRKPKEAFYIIKNNMTVDEFMAFIEEVRKYGEEHQMGSSQIGSSHMGSSQSAAPTIPAVPQSAPAPLPVAHQSAPSAISAVRQSAPGYIVVGQNDNYCIIGYKMVPRIGEVAIIRNNNTGINVGQISLRFLKNNGYSTEKDTKLVAGVTIYPPSF